MRQEELVALKAFYLGRALASSSSRAEAIRKIEAGLEALSSSTAPETGIRETFYALLLAEVFRGEKAALKYRQQASEASAKAETEAFGLYMNIVEATQDRVHVDRLSGVAISKPEIKNERGTTHGADWWDQGVSWDYAIAALGRDNRDVDDKAEKFLHRISLKEIMEKHGLWSVST